MNGFVKSPWKWNEIFDVCAKFFSVFYRESAKSPSGIVASGLDDDLAEELYCMASTESEDIYVNSALIKTYADVIAFVHDYEEKNGEIVA